MTDATSANSPRRAGTGTRCRRGRGPGRSSRCVTARAPRRSTGRMPRSNCRAAPGSPPQPGGRRVPPAARIRLASRSLGVLREQRRARRRPGAPGRRRAGDRVLGLEQRQHDRDDVRARDHQRLACSLAHPPRLVAEPHGEEGCCPRPPIAIAVRHALARTLGWGSSRRRSEHAQRLRRPRCSKGLERSRPDVGRRVTRQLGNVWLCERWIPAREAGRAEANEVTGVREQRDEPIAGERSKPIELRQRPELGSPPVVSASIRASSGPLVTLAKPSQGRDRRDANVAVCTPDSLLEEPAGRAFAVDLRHERAGRVVRRAPSAASEPGSTPASERSRPTTTPETSSSQPPHAIAQITASVAASTVPRYRHPARARAHPSGGGRPEPATSQRARRSGRSGATPSPSARRRPTRARGGRRRRPADRSR